MGKEVYLNMKTIEMLEAIKQIKKIDTYNEAIVFMYSQLDEYAGWRN